MSLKHNRNAITQVFTKRTTVALFILLCSVIEKQFRDSRSKRGRRSPFVVLSPSASQSDDKLRTADVVEMIGIAVSAVVVVVVDDRKKPPK